MGLDPTSVGESNAELQPGERAWIERYAERIVGHACAVTALDPGEALSRWRELVEGRWALVDAVERDGRRYVVARRIEAGRGRGGGLSRREREVATYAVQGMGIKEVAVALGLSSSTVGTHLGSAMRKLGVRTRAELATLLGCARGAAP